MDKGGKLAGGNPTRGRMKNDFYATHPDSTKTLLKVEEIIYPALEPACGEGHISKLLDSEHTYSTDLIYRGYGDGDIDFLKHKYYKNYNTVITNPPFALFQEFVEKALQVTNKKVIMFGKLVALEGMKRATFLETTPLRTVYVFKKRQQPLRNGSDIDELTGKKMASSTMAFAWFVWEIGYTGKPQIEWI
jgi:hypothetical protein|tara:strand:- start:1428 stop:1997 length:570 start_codon:yes stop_codon:yes gene_type:complete